MVHLLRGEDKGNNADNFRSRMVALDAFFVNTKYFIGKDYVAFLGNSRKNMSKSLPKVSTRPKRSKKVEFYPLLRG